MDNNSASAQASNIYFSLGTNSTGAGPGVPSCNTTAGVGCAVKFTQSTSKRRNHCCQLTINVQFGL